jgi:two-component sensor histidine kinase/ABC-type amino acid transport substrate-binding protein
MENRRPERVFHISFFYIFHAPFLLILYYNADMQRSAIIVTLFILLLGSPAPGETLRVICDDNYPPYVFRDEKGALQGIVVDLWNEWAQVTGNQVELAGMDWQRALQEMKEGKADVIDTIFETVPRMAYFLFTPPYADIEVPIFVHKSISGFSSLESLKGIRIAVKSGDACISVLKNAGITDLIEYASYSEIVDHAKKMDIKAFCMDKPPAMYLMVRAGIDLDYRVVTTLYTGHFSRAVLRGNEGLLNRVQKGFERISEERYRQIERRWFGATESIRFDSRFILIPSFIVFFLFLILLVFVQLLKKQVARKTAQLSNEIQKLEESQKRNKSFIEAFPDLFFVLDRDGKYLDYHCTDTNQLKAITCGEEGQTISDFFETEIVERILEAVRKVIETGGLERVEYRLDVPAGRRIFEARIVALDETSALYIARDITERIEHEKTIAKSLREKEVLLKEIHHRVKNNLQVISSLVSLQADRFCDAEDRSLMQETQQRIQSIAQLHELLYKSDDFLSINIQEYLTEIVDDLIVAYSAIIDRVEIHTEIEDITMNIDFAMPIGLIVNELVSNSMKYAFPEDLNGHLLIQFARNGNSMILTVSDDGIGLPEDFSVQSAESLGFVLVTSLARQLGGSAVRLGGEGTAIRIDIPDSPPGWKTEGFLTGSD